MFTDFGNAHRIGSGRGSLDIRRLARVLLYMLLIVLTPLSHAQSSDPPIPSPLDWLISKAEVEETALDSRHAVSGQNRSLLKKYNAPGRGESQHENLALKFSDADEIRHLEAEIITLYGAPEKQSAERKVWTIRHSDTNGSARFLLTYQTLRSGEVIIGVETEGRIEPERNRASGKL